MSASTRGLIMGLALAAAAGITASAIVAASGDARTISLYHIHTKETLTILYKQDGKYIPEALAKINWIMRDWRKNEVKDIDPETIDIIWEMHTELGSREPVNIICGYRSHDTNEMLRRTVGGQASQSQHITGKAVDISFPDVPARLLRYSALVRERGGVGYYPTSAIPFVHVDSGRVRSWPRMPRDELALLFPSGHSKYEPADGGPISPADVRGARERRKDLAVEVAAYLDKRSRPAGAIVVADASAAPSPPAPRPAMRPVPAAPEHRMAVGGPIPSSDNTQTIAAAPELVAAPRLTERPSRFTPTPSVADRRGLDQLVTLASLEERAPPTRAVAEPAPASPPARPPTKPHGEAKPAPLLARMTTGALPAPKAPPQPQIKVAALEADLSIRAPGPMTEAGRFGWGTGWAQAPAYDEDHPEELSYRPFPLAPLLTASPSADDPALAKMVHPDIAKTLDLIDEEGSILPMSLRPGQQVAELMWAQEFRGEAVNVSELEATNRSAPAPAGLAAKSVRTLPR